MDNQIITSTQEFPFSMESILNSHLKYHSQNTLNQITFDCAQRCLNYEDGIISSKEQKCVKNCALSYYENFFSSQLN